MVQMHMTLLYSCEANIVKQNRPDLNFAVLYAHTDAHLSGHLVIAGFFIKLPFQTLGFCLPAGQRRERWQGQHEVEIVVGGDAVEAFQSARQAAMDEHIFTVWSLEAADGFHAAPAGADPIARSPVIDMTREQAIGAVIAVMRAIGRRADKTMAVPAFEHFFRRGALLAHITRAGILLFTRTRNAPVCFSHWWISSFASIGGTSREASKARQRWPRKGKGQDPLWLWNMAAYT